MSEKNLRKWSKKSWVDGKKYQMIQAKRKSWHPKTVNLKTFYPNLTFKNRYTTSKNGSTGRLFVTPPLSEIGKKMSKYTPHFQSAFSTAATTLTDFKTKHSGKTEFLKKKWKLLQCYIASNRLGEIRHSRYVKMHDFKITNTTTLYMQSKRQKNNYELYK